MPKKKVEDEKQIDPKQKVIPGLGLTRDQLLNYLRGKREEDKQKPAFMQYLYELDDWMNEGALVTETSPSMVINKVRMKLIMAASDPTREKPLIQIFLEEYNREMVGLERKGRLEGLGALQALMSDSDDERALSLGR